MDEKRRQMLQKEAESLRGKGEKPNINFWAPKSGVKSVIRILPHKDYAKNPEAVFFKKIRVHWGVGPEKRRLICRSTIGERCPVCDFVQSLLNSSRKEDVPLAKELVAQDRYVMNIVDVSEPDKGVQVFECGRGLFNDILQLFLDEEYGDMDSLENGRNIKIERTGTTKFDTRYMVMPVAERSRVNPRVMEKVYDLDAIYKPMSEEEMIAVLEGNTEPDVELTPEDEPLIEIIQNVGPRGPLQSAPSPSPSPSSVPEISIDFSPEPAADVKRDDYLQQIRKEMYKK